MEGSGTQPTAMPTNPTDADKGIQPTARGAAPGRAGGAQAPANGPTTGDVVKEAAAEAKRRLKIDTEEVDEDEVIKVYKERKGHQRAANKELQEGRAARKQAEEFLSMMKDKGKLFDVLKKMGHDPRQLSEEYLTEILKQEMMDPKERELMETRNKLTTYEERDKKAAEQAKVRKDLEVQQKLSEEYSKQFIAALEESKLPPTKRMVGEMAGYMRRAAEIKMKMTPQEAAKLVQQDEEARLAHRLQHASPEELVQMLKEDGLKKIRGYDTSRLKDPNAQLKTPVEQGEITRKRDTSTQMTHQQWRDFNRR